MDVLAGREVGPSACAFVSQHIGRGGAVGQLAVTEVAHCRDGFHGIVVGSSSMVLKRIIELI